MRPPLVLYSANIGGYDRGPQLHGEMDANWFSERILFSDQPVAWPGWSNVVVPAYFRDPKRTVQYLKTRPDLLFGEAVATIWVDATLRDIRLDDAAMDRLVAPPGVVVAAPPHTLRATLRAEAEVVARFGLDTPTAIARALALLDAMEFPDRSGLSATAFVYRDLRDPRVRAANRTWQRMILHGSRRDQLSFNAALWSAGLRAHDIPVHWGRPNEIYTLGPHRRAVQRRIADDATHPAQTPIPEQVAQEDWSHADLAILRDLARCAPAAPRTAGLVWGLDDRGGIDFALPAPDLAPAREALRAAARAARCIRDDSDAQGVHAALCLMANPNAVVLADLPDPAVDRLRRRFGDRLRPMATPGLVPDLLLLGGNPPEAPASGTALVIGPPGGGREHAALALRAQGWREEECPDGSGWLQRLMRG